MTQARDLADGKFDTNTLVVDAANNRVGVGTASPAVNLDIVEDSASTDAILGITAGTGGRAQIRSEAQSDGTSSVLSFHTMSSSNTSEVGRWLAGGGLTFNGDTAAANALDDYEEGTFTPSFISGASGITYTEQSGRYTKIGNMVHFQIFLDVNTVSSTTSSGVNIGGLPFTSFNGQPLPSYAIGYNNNFHAGGNTLTALGNSNTTTINLYQDDGTSLIGTESNFTHDLYISGSYIAA